MSKRDSSQDPNQRRRTPQKVKKMIGNYSYDLSEKIGSGFSSSVYRGVNSLTGQTVAIKVIDLHQITTPISKTLLKNEIHVLRQINHPNLLKVHDIYLTQNNTYIISELCDQGDLADLIHKHKRLDQKTAFNLLRQILSGMRALQYHSVAILHRDIKPANILMSHGVPKLADFGFAVCQNQQLDQSILKNFNVGTPLYMAPETILYNQYSEKSDIWALGVVLYEMLHGFPPYKAPSDSSLLNLYLTTPVSFTQSTSLPNEVKKLISNMLMLDHNHRYSIDQVMEFLEPPKLPPKVVQSQGKQPQAHFRSTEYQSRDRSSRDSSPFMMTQQSNPKTEDKKFRSITPQTRDLRRVPDVAKVPQPLARKLTPIKGLGQSKERSISPFNNTFMPRKSSEYDYRRTTQTHHSSRQGFDTLPNNDSPAKILMTSDDNYTNLINKYKKSSLPLNEVGKPLATKDPQKPTTRGKESFFDAPQEPTKKEMIPFIEPTNDKQILLEQIQSFQERLGETQREYEKEEAKKLGKGLPPSERVIVLLCRLLQRLSEKLDNYLTRQSSLSPPSNSDQRSILIMKCTFLFWKCMAIKSFQMSKSQPEQSKQVHAQFVKRYQQMHQSSYLTALIEGDRRFEVLFDEQVEDDCSGFYAILTHYVSELIKAQIKQLQRDLNGEVNSDLVQTAKLMDKLVMLHQVLLDHLKHLTDIQRFAENCTEQIENGLIDDKVYLNQESIAEIIRKAKASLRII